MKLAYLRKRSKLKRYGLTIILIIVIFPLIAFFPKNYFQIIHSQTISFLVFILIVAISSWYGGLGPGIFSTILTALVIFFTLLKEDLPSHPEIGDLVLTLLFLVIGLLISIVSEARYEVELQKDEFIGLVTHELKNPLSVIKGFAGLLNQYFKKLGKHKAANFAVEIDSQSDKLLELINDLLDINRIEVGKLVYNNELFDFDGLVKEIISHQKIINGNRTIILSGSSNSIIDGDRYRIGQIITNLLTNAIKYSPNKSPVEVKIKKGKKEVTLGVKDYGIGIPRSEHKKVFNQYYRTRSNLKGRTEGLGLGLYICRSIIGRHKGRIWIKSNGEKGSTFFFSLPV